MNSYQFGSKNRIGGPVGPQSLVRRGTFFQTGLLSAILSLGVLITLPPAAIAAPTLSSGGALNGASFLPAAVPGGSIAQGSFFSGFGTELGPAEEVVNTTLPLPTELGGVQVTVTVGEASWDAYLTFVRADQFNAIMPSEAPAGEAELRVTYDGETSEPVTISIVPSSFGIFSAIQTGAGPGAVTNFVSEAEQPLNSTATTLTPGQVATIWGTGLMGIVGADATAPLESGSVRDLREEIEVAVMIGGQPVEEVLYAGRSAEFPGIDQISFETPAEAVQGCYVPLLVLVNGVPSNEVTIGVSADGSPCQDAVNPLSSALVGGSRLGLAAAVRISGAVALTQTLDVDFTIDVLAGNFNNQDGGELAYNRFLSLPPVGSCSRQIFRGINLLELLGGTLPNLDFGPEIDAGPTITMTRNGGDERIIEQDPDKIGRYVDTVGGGLALFGPADDPYYEAGEYNLTSVGGEDVGPFDVDFVIPARPAWLNREAVVAGPVDRTENLTLAWEPGDPAEPQIMFALAANVDVASGAASGVMCLVPQSTGGFVVPSALLAAVPATTPPGSAGPSSLGFVGVGSLPVIEPFQAEGLDLGVVIGATVDIQSVTFE